ncbi:MAG: BON domain-containing protein [Thermoguttaceae bacterium]
MRSQFSAIAIALCVALGAQQTASAQTTFGNTSANNRTFTSDSSFGSTSNFGGSSVAGGGSALGNLGGRELDLTQSAENTGRTLFPADQFQVGNRQVGQFVGTSLFDPRMFIGAATSGAQSSASSLGGRALQGRSPQGSSLQGRSIPGAGGPGIGMPGLGGGGPSAAKSIRTTARLAFETPQIDSGHVSASLVRRFQQPGPIQTRLPVEVTVDGRTATLRGQVATEYDRILAERFVRMEPGISQVANELVVAQTSTDTPVDPDPAPTPAEAN